MESLEDAPGWVTGNGQGELAQQKETGRAGGLTSIPCMTGGFEVLAVE